MKTHLSIIILILLTGIPIVTMGQYYDEGNDTPEMDSATAVALPWYDNNQFLYDYLQQRDFYDLPLQTDPLSRTAATTCPTARYQLPVRIHIYSNNDGTNQSILQLDAEDVFNEANDIFDVAGTRVQFYIDDILFKNNTEWNTDIDNGPVSYSFFFR